MLYYDRTDVSKGINVNKDNDMRECVVCPYNRYEF